MSPTDGSCRKQPLRKRGWGRGGCPLLWKTQKPFLTSCFLQARVPICLSFFLILLSSFWYFLFYFRMQTAAADMIAATGINSYFISNKIHLTVWASLVVYSFFSTNFVCHHAYHSAKKKKERFVFRTVDGYPGDGKHKLFDTVPRSCPRACHRYCP